MKTFLVALIASFIFFLLACIIRADAVTYAMAVLQWEKLK